MRYFFYLCDPSQFLGADSTRLSPSAAYIRGFAPALTSQTYVGNISAPNLVTAIY